MKASPGTTTSYKPRALAAQFGDGYMQRLADGINTNLLQMSLSIDSLTRAEAKTISDFFSTQLGVIPFWFNTPHDGVAKKWICPEWQVSEAGSASNISVTATLVEVIDP